MNLLDPASTDKIFDLFNSVKSAFSNALTGSSIGDRHAIFFARIIDLKPRPHTDQVLDTTTSSSIAIEGDYLGNLFDSHNAITGLQSPRAHIDVSLIFTPFWSSCLIR